LLDGHASLLLSRAFRWHEMLENGTHATIAEIAPAERINQSYVGRVLRLPLLAPDIVGAIPNGRQPAEMTLAGLMQTFPVGWTAPSAGALKVTALDRTGHTTASSSCRSRNS
jgi:hypothetical protein